jgi:tripartite-type tricarboxylate transporter receptor subunit TctC
MNLQYCAVALAAILSLPTLANGQDYPTRGIRIVVPFPPGAGNDVQARLLGKKFTEAMGQSVVVDNRPGANGLVGAESVARSQADGYTLLFTSAGLAANATLYKRPGFDPMKDLAGVSLFSIAPQYLVVHPSVPARSVKELVALAKKHPGKLNAGSNGSGASNHLAIEMFKEMAGIQVTHIPYKGGSPNMNAVLAGEVDFAFLGATTALPQIRVGKLRGLAVTSAKSSSAAPQLPTMSSVYPEYEYVNWYALFAPSGTPAAVMAKLSSESAKALQSPDVRKLLTAEGIEPAGTTPGEMTIFFKREVERSAKLIKAANLKVE